MTFKKNVLNGYFLDMGYVHPSKWLEDYNQKSTRLKSQFEAFEDWVGRNFDRAVPTYLYGGSISGCIAFSFLKNIELISVKGVIDNNTPLPYLAGIQHLSPNDFTGEADLIFVSVCPTHYNEIQCSFIRLLNPSPITWFMFRHDLGTKKHKSKTIKKSSVDSFRASQFKTVMVGDSLTLGFNHHGLIKKNIENKGIDGHLTTNVLQRLESCPQLSARQTCVMIGINDLIQGASHKDVFIVYERIIDTLIQKGGLPIIQSTLYVSNKFTSVIDPLLINQEVDCLNALLKKKCSSQSLPFLDLNKTIAPHGHLPFDMTTDGIHLNSRAYKIWAYALIPLLL